MKTIDEITTEIAQQAPEAWKRSNSSNWHSLILTSEGELYWSEEVDQHSVSERVWKGADCRIMRVQGQPWNGADEEAHAMIEAGQELSGELDALAVEDECETEFEGRDGHTYRQGRKSYGYDPEKWYRVGDLLDWAEYLNQDTDPADYMADAIREAEEFWAKKSES